MAKKLYLVQPEEAKMNLLLYGAPGSGKTILAATAEDHPKMEHVLFLNVEGGLLSIAGRRDIRAIDITCIEDLETVFWDLANQDPEYKDIQTVVIDSGSELQSLTLQEIVAESIRKKPGKERDQDEIFLEDYGKSSAQLKRLLRYFRDLPRHVIITALPKEIYDAEGASEPSQVLPSFTTKLATSLMGFADFVWYLYETEDGTRSLLTSKKGAYIAKTREPTFAEALGQVVEDPNLSTIYDLFLNTTAPAKKGKAK